jgi:hypothetical protein
MLLGGVEEAAWWIRWGLRRTWLAVFFFLISMRGVQANIIFLVFCVSVIFPFAGSGDVGGRKTFQSTYGLSPLDN